MLLATIVLLCVFPENESVAKAIAEHSLTLANNSPAKSANVQPLPSAPQSKVAADADLLRSADSTTKDGDAVAPPAALKPVKPDRESPHETRTQRRVWYALIFGGHGAAVFDAWSTRRALSQGYGTEANPLLRPFSHSGAMYAATQVSPLLLDFVGKRMMTSRHRWLRRVWWLPQTAGMGFSIGAGVHNVELAP